MVVSDHISDMNALSGNPGSGAVHNCRCIWDVSDDDPVAYVTLSNCFGPKVSLMLNMRHLDGIADDSFDVEVKDNSDNWINVGHYADWQEGSEEPIGEETWIVTLFDISLVTLDEGQPIEIRITATGGKWSGFNTFGQVAFDWIELVDDPAPTLRTLEVPVDIKPASCPNPLNVKSKGVLPVAILGTADFDVTQIDPSTVQLAVFGPGSEPFDPIIPPDEKKRADVATPYEPYIGKMNCVEGCNDLGPDGYMDVTLKFNMREVGAALSEVPHGECMIMAVTGSLFDGTSFIGEDVVLIINKGRK